MVPAILPFKARFATYYLVAAVVGVCLQAPAGAGTGPETPPGPTVADCRKCHSNIVNFIEQDGRAHKTKVTCTDCHVGHPPRVRNIIPKCGRCHQGREHFTLDNCLLCHKNPHTPLRITLPDHATYQCVTCHKEQIKELRTHLSTHSTFDCTICHTRHGYLPPCFNCHAPHTKGMTNEECQDCHRPHMPLVVTYPDDTPPYYCGACHGDVYRLLSQSHAKHRNLACAFCHKKKHRTIPRCTDCHGLPHDKKLIDKFNGCRGCHGIAHNLKLNRIDMRLEQKAYLDARDEKNP